MQIFDILLRKKEVQKYVLLNLSYMSCFTEEEYTSFYYNENGISIPFVSHR